MTKVIGYRGIGQNKGLFVDQEDAVEYVCKQCGIQFTDPSAPDYLEFHEIIIEWFFSGNWVAVTEEAP